MNQQTHTPFTEDEVTDLATRLAAWARTLTPRDQYILSALLAAATAVDGGDVQGYRLNAMDPREPTGPTPIGSPTTVGTVVAVLGGAGSATPYVGAAIDSAIAGVIANPLQLFRP